MRRAAIAGGVLALVLIGAAATTRVAQMNEEAAVREAVDHYLQAHATGQGEHARILFHPQSMLFWVAADTLSQRTGEAYVAGFRGQPQADEAQRRRWISSVDVTGTAAVARVVLDYPNALITDYFSLLRIEGEWKVVNKIFHVEPKGD